MGRRPVAGLQNHLYAARQITSIEMVPYLSRLCQALAESMIGDSGPVLLKVEVAGGRLPSGQARSVGLLVTEPLSMHSSMCFLRSPGPLESASPMRRRGPTGSFRSQITGLGCRTRTVDASGRRNRALAG